MDTEILRQSIDLKQQRENRQKEVARERLCKIATKKIKTTMIGALSSVEKFFGFLWNQTDQALTPEQQHLKNLYEEARAEILDKGNTQIRNLEAEFTNYEVTWRRYNHVLPVMGEIRNDE